MKNINKRKIVTIIALLVLFFMLVSIIAVINSVEVKLDINKLNNINNTLTLLDYDGNDIALPVFLGSKQYINFESIPKHTIDAFVCVEDKRFFEHNGVDTVRLFGAMAKNVMSLSWKEGASTITQQLIKNTHLTSDKNLQRKINEVTLAVQLENRMSKDKILEMYLNTIYFGGNAYGLQSASQTYFGCDANQLSIEESATLAGMIKAPNSYNPITNMDRCMQRRNVVLSLMLEQNKITNEQHDLAVGSPIELTENNTQCFTYTYGVISQACELLKITPNQLLNSNFTIKTYYDDSCQQALMESVASDQTMSNNKLADMVSLVCDNRTSGIRAMYCRGNCTQLSQYRQIGSTAKPLAVYAPAIDCGMTMASMVLDEPTSFAGYKPSNYGNKYNGWVTATSALSHSMNVPAVKILNSIGTDKSVEYLNKMCINADDTDNLSMALGNINNGVNVYQLAQGYTTLANNGLSNKPSYIMSILNNGKEIFNNNKQDIQVFKPTTAYITTNMLMEAVKSGTAKKLNTVKCQLACKTGTVGNKEGNTDAISCAYDSNNTTICWINGKLDNSITGGTAPTECIGRFMTNYNLNAEPFRVPSDIVWLDIDNNMLLQKHKAYIACSSTKNDIKHFAFDKQNCPSEYAIDSNMQIVATVSDNVITLKMPDNSYEYTIHRIENGKDTTLGPSNNGILLDADRQYGQTYLYYADVYYCNKLIGRTATCSIKVCDKNSGNNANEDLCDNDDVSEGNRDLTDNVDILHWFYLNMR